MRNVSKTRRSKPSNRHRTTRDYDFLQYIRIVFKWALSNNDLSKAGLEMLLYLYPMGTFTKNDFFLYHKTMGIYQGGKFNQMLKDGWIVLWRPRKRNESALYTLSSKAKMLCSRMHKMCTGEIKIPESDKFNNLAKSGGERINGYYMDVIKKMNKNRETKKGDE